VNLFSKLKRHLKQKETPQKHSQAKQSKAKKEKQGIIKQINSTNK